MSDEYMMSVIKDSKVSMLKRLADSEADNIDVIEKAVESNFLNKRIKEMSKNPTKFNIRPWRTNDWQVFNAISNKAKEKGLIE